MTPPNTDRQSSRRKSALWSAVLSVVLLVLALINLGTIVPLWISFRIRLKEIEGGEEDAAAEY